MKALMTRFIREEDGAAASEYAILVAGVAVAVFAAVKAFDIEGIFKTVNTTVSGKVTAAAGG